MVAGIGAEHGETNENRRQRDTVIEPALHADRLPDVIGNIVALYDGLAERRIGRREDQRHQHDSHDAARTKKQQADTGTEQHRQRQSDQQESRRRIGRWRAEKIATDQRRIDKQDQRQRELGNQFDRPHLGVKLEQPEDQRARKYANGQEEHRPRDAVALRESRKQPEREEQNGEEDQQVMMMHIGPASLFLLS